MKCIPCGVAALIALLLVGGAVYLIKHNEVEQGALNAQGVIEALNRNANITHVETAQDDLLSGTRTTLKINDEFVQIWEYKTRTAAAKDAANIEPDGSTIHTGWNSVATVDWIAPPHWYTKGRVIVLYNGENEETLATLNELLGSAFAGSVQEQQQQQQGDQQPLQD